MTMAITEKASTLSWDEIGTGSKTLGLRSLSTQRAATDMRRLENIERWLQLGCGNLSPTGVAAPIHGTCQWIFSDPNYRTWIEEARPAAAAVAANNGGDVLFVVGAAGYGKSVLAAMLHDKLSADEGSLVLFHKFGSSSVGPQSSTPSSLAAQCIRHLLVKSKPSCLLRDSKMAAVVEWMHALSLEFSGGPHTCRFGLLWPIFEELLALYPTPAFLIVDALDECTYDAHCDCDILAFLSSIRDTFSNSPRMKLVVFSRPLPILQDFGTATNTISLHGSQTVHSDQTLFFDAEYQRLSMDPESQAAVRDRLERLSRGSFLWTKLYLALLDRSSTIADFNHSMHENPPDIWDLYAEMTKRSVAGLNMEQLTCRRSILLVLCSVCVSLSLQEMKILLSLRGDAVKTIFNLCGHLVLWHGEYLQLMHPIVKEFPMGPPSRHPYNQQIKSADGLSEAESHSLLALRCLKCLADEQYGEKNRIGQRLRQNFGRSAVLEDAVATPDAMPYKYAAEYWDFHLTQVPSPDTELLQLANDFLNTFQFVFCSEFSYEIAGSSDVLGGAYRIISKTLLDLKAWHSTLPGDKKKELVLTDYFITPYERIAEEYAASAEDDKVLPWLPMLRLTGFFWLKADMEKYTKVAQQTRDGLVITLGAVHPLALLSRGNLGMAYTYLKRLPEAMAEYAEVVEAERDVLGTDDPRFYETVSLKARVECLMVDLPAAMGSSSEACEGLLRLAGETSNLYLSARYWLGCALEYAGRLDEALRVYRDMYTKRGAQFGPRDPVAMAGRVTAGIVLRKTRAWDESIAHLEAGLAWARATIPSAAPTDNVFLMEAALHLLLSYRDAGMVGGAIALLQGFFVGLDRGAYNRAVLWLLLDLADMLRARGGPGDDDQARVNFEHVLRYRGSHDEEEDDDDEPDPPALLDLAERVLRLVRALEPGKARALLEAAGAEWYRPADLWIWLGSPAADTTQVRAPALVVRDPRGGNRGQHRHESKRLSFWHSRRGDLR